MGKGRRVWLLVLAALSAATGVAVAFTWPGTHLLEVSFVTQYLSVALQELLLIGVPALLLTRRRDGRAIPVAALKRPGRVRAGLTAVSAVACTLAGVLVSLVWLYFLSFFGVSPMEPVLKNPASAGEYLLAFLCAALVPALSEELMFRGLLLKWLRGKLGPLRAVVLSGALFALFHLSLQGMAALLLIGVFLSALAVRSGGLVLPALFHLVYNAAAIVLNALSFVPSFRTVLFGAVLFALTAAALLRREGAH